MRRLVTVAVSVILLAVLLVSPPARAADGSPDAAFPIRGIKGLWWDGLDKYRKALPWLADHHLNFLMFCYTSFPASGKDWRADYTPDQLAGMKELAAQADQLKVELCLSFNPGLWSKPPLTYSSDADYAIAWKKVQAVHAVGIRSFAICLDDIKTDLQPADKEKFGTLAKAQVHLVNRLWADLHALDPKARLIFCPSAYWTKNAETHPEYITTIADIDPAVFMFWTGPEVCSPTITKADAEKYAAWIKRKPIVWDNYPVNDMYPWRPLLSPLKGRSPDLAEATSGYMANPMKQWEISKIPLATTAQYCNDPAGYYWKRAAEASINEWPESDRAVIRELVDVYGPAFWGEPGFPPKPTPGKTDAETANVLLRYTRLFTHLERNKDLAAVFEDVKPPLLDDIHKLEQSIKHTPPPKSVAPATP